MSTPHYTLSRKDEIMVIDAAAMVTVSDDAAAYTLLINLADGRWLVLNNIMDNATQAARLLHDTRKQGCIELSQWTDVSFLRDRFSLNTDKAMCVGGRPLMRGSHRPMHPEADELSLLQEGDAVRILRTVSPADDSKSWWLVTLSLSEGTVLQHVLPFETSGEAQDLVKLIARTGTYVTEDFFDATDEMQSAQIDRSEEMEVDEDGKPRLHS